MSDEPDVGWLRANVDTQTEVSPCVEHSFRIQLAMDLNDIPPEYVLAGARFPAPQIGMHEKSFDVNVDMKQEQPSLCTLRPCLKELLVLTPSRLPNFCLCAPSRLAESYLSSPSLVFQSRRRIRREEKWQYGNPDPSRGRCEGIVLEMGTARQK